MDSEGVTRILQAYGMQPARVLGAQKGYRNEAHPAVLEDGRTVNLIIYKSEADIVARVRRTNTVSDYVADSGLPARRTADPRIIQLNSRRFAGVYEYLPGHTIPWEAYTKAHIKQLGAQMAAMHHTLANMLPGDYTAHTVADEYGAILHRMIRYFSDNTVQTALGNKLGIQFSTTTLGAYATMLHIVRQLPGQHMLHMDFVRSNILFAIRGGTPVISGIIDFEKTAYGHPLCDAARTYAFLLVDCKYKTEKQVRKYFLQSGYAKQNRGIFRDITISGVFKNDISIFNTLTNMFLAHDFYKFLRHNPYESLEQNEHYMRTKQILINRNIISAL